MTAQVMGVAIRGQCVDRSAWRRVLESLHRAWGRQRQRRALARLDERMLADIGVSEAQRNAELAKPFWVA